MMNGMLLGLAMLVSATGASVAPAPPRATVAPAIFSFELPDTDGLRDLPAGRSRCSFGPRPERTSAPFAQATRSKRSKVDRIIAIAAGASIGWVVGGGIGYAVTPKRGPYDDTSGLKGVLIGAPIGAVAGALIGYRLTK